MKCRGCGWSYPRIVFGLDQRPPDGLCGLCILEPLLEPAEHYVDWFVAFRWRQTHPEDEPYGIAYENRQA